MGIRTALFFALAANTLWAIPTYTQKDVVIPSAVSPFGNCPLGATQYLPSTTPKALVIFVHGSGPQDRDESMPGGIAPFRDIAQYLSSLGVATLRYDKRSSIAACVQMMAPNYQDFTPDVFIEDVENVIRYAQASAKLGELPLFLLGHSQGVNFVLEIAASGKFPLAGTLLLAGLGAHAIDATVIRQYEYLIQTNKYPSQTPQLKKDLAQAKVFFPEVRGGTAAASDQFLGTHTRFWKDWIAITDRAKTIAAQSPAPSLVVQGGQDWNVSEDDFNALMTATGAVPGSQAIWFTGINHWFTEENSTQVDTAVLSALRTWVGTIVP